MRTEVPEDIDLSDYVWNKWAQFEHMYPNWRKDDDHTLRINHDILNNRGTVKSYPFVRVAVLELLSKQQEQNMSIQDWKQ